MSEECARTCDAKKRIEPFALGTAYEGQISPLHSISFDARIQGCSGAEADGEGFIISSVSTTSERRKCLGVN